MITKRNTQTFYKINLNIYTNYLYVLHMYLCRKQGGYLLQSEWCKNKQHFTRVRTVPQKRLLPSPCVSAWPHVPVRLPLYGFPWHLIMGTSMKICQ